MTVDGRTVQLYASHCSRSVHRIRPDSYQPLAFAGDGDLFHSVSTKQPARNVDDADSAFVDLISRE